jgi:hypothetical protein
MNIQEIDYYKNKNLTKNTIIKEYIIQNIYIYSINKELNFFKKKDKNFIKIAPFSFYEVDKENLYNI